MSVNMAANVIDENGTSTNVL